MEIALGLAGGALIGALAGVVAAVISLRAKHARNAILAKRGRAGVRDCVFEKPLVYLSAIGGAIVGGVVAGFADREVALIASLAPAAVIAALSVIGAAVQALSRAP